MSLLYLLPSVVTTKTTTHNSDDNDGEEVDKTAKQPRRSKSALASPAITGKVITLGEFLS